MSNPFEEDDEVAKESEGQEREAEEMSRQIKLLACLDDIFPSPEKTANPFADDHTYPDDFVNLSKHRRYLAKSDGIYDTKGQGMWLSDNHAETKLNLLNELLMRVFLEYYLAIKHCEFHEIASAEVNRKEDIFKMYINVMKG